jgi:hypothetical protein
MLHWQLRKQQRVQRSSDGSMRNSAGVRLQSAADRLIGTVASIDALAIQVALRTVVCKWSHACGCAQRTRHLVTHWQQLTRPWCTGSSTVHLCLRIHSGRMLDCMYYVLHLCLVQHSLEC